MSDWTKDLRILRYHWKWVSLVVVLVGGSILLTRLAGATTVLEKTFPELVQDAEVIAVGTVTAVAAEWNAEKEAPFTLVTFSELEILKGDLGQTELTLHFLGGPTPDGLTMQIAGVPRFNLGERTVIFCVGNKSNAVPLVGMWQGVYRVVFDAERGIETIYNHTMQPVTTLPTGERGIIHDDTLTVLEQKASPPEAMSLETFTHLIEQEVHDEQGD